MTSGTKLHQAKGMLQTLAGNFHTFAMDTQDPMAKQMYTNSSKQLEQILQDLNTRIDYAQQQEPTYKMENMIQQQQDQAQRNSQNMRTK